MNVRVVLGSRPLEDWDEVEKNDYSKDTGMYFVFHNTFITETDKFNGLLRLLCYHNTIFSMLHNPYAEVLNPPSFINKYPYPVPAMCRKRSHTPQSSFDLKSLQAKLLPVLQSTHAIHSLLQSSASQVGRRFLSVD